MRCCSILLLPIPLLIRAPYFTGADRADKITSLHYNRYECNVSDHRPISAAFDVKVKRIVAEKRAMVWEQVEDAWFSVEFELLNRAKEWYKLN